MEQLQKELSNLQITDQIHNNQNSQKTGILYDLDQLKHNSSRQHVECPGRLQSIYDHLNKKQLLQKPNIELVNKLHPGLREIIQYVHNDDYIDFIDQMWPEKTSKKEIYIIDTYFNKDSAYCAYLGVGAIQQSIDKIENNDWKNAFCIIRPPGHHSGYSNVCTGFCFFNNVAIAAKYIQKKYNKKKILIFDWDIHHGDGTQIIFKDDPSVMLISFHRYDEGMFYPSSGSPSNVGEGKGEGYKINVGWNIGHKEYSLKAGTDEYIYAFERIAWPIIQEFEPDFVIVSAGFDSAEGDPLGQCSVSYEGYAYMTQRLMQINQGKILVVLEGGYNLDSICWASESVLRVLIGEDFSYLDNKKDQICPNFVGFSAVESAFQNLKKYWINLSDAKLQIYTEKIIENSQKKSLISAGHQSKFQIKDNKIFKQAKENELLFYKKLWIEKQQQADFLKFIPIFYGLEQIEEQEYVVLQNLTQNCQLGSIIDLKIGQNTIHESYTQKKHDEALLKDHNSTSFTLGFRISGVIIKDQKGVPIEKVNLGKFLQKFTKEQTQEYIIKVFKSNQKEEINMEALENFMIFTQDLLEFFEKRNKKRFIASSIIIIVDNIQNTYQFKLIDFNYVDDLKEDKNKDNNFIFGLQNLINMLQDIKKKY
ncbi:hypothetical protein IMG5_162410 [Ichthyophthirius multifiliis]|uniref:histone deacetylase n=1 Tax=Ichthyophthirius multifiliis TaxID=5932 RepID=G0R078_ICHMU|nr:hypothetical protein IMG5_162410 [Ichthyophthirius multifiliis]EGR29138.1 hypothetical protein IMG5_162410 [Ichthyophthirius multifiliis]|eukprot:XP_004030374.1 hypothetical protein IMG5_162410 [Ichthyophthirius multifiliis]